MAIEPHTSRTSDAAILSRLIHPESDNLHPRQPKLGSRSVSSKATSTGCTSW